MRPEEAAVHRSPPTTARRCEARTLIIATGARANYLGLPSEDRFKNKGVSALRRLRRVPAAVPQQADRGRRRRGLGGGGGGVPDEVRQQGPPARPPGRAAGEQDHGRPGQEAPEDRDPAGTPRWTRCSARTRPASPAVRVKNNKTGATEDAAGDRAVPGHRPHAERRLPRRAGGADRDRVRQVDDAGPDVHQRGRGVRRRRRGRRLLPAGDQRRRDRVHGRPGRRAVARAPRADLNVEVLRWLIRTSTCRPLKRGSR